MIPTVNNFVLELLVNTKKAEKNTLKHISVLLITLAPTHGRNGCSYPWKAHFLFSQQAVPGEAMEIQGPLALT